MQHGDAERGKLTKTRKLNKSVAEGKKASGVLLLRSNPSRQHSKVLYRWGSGEEERMENTENVGVKRKFNVLAQAPYSLQGNGRQLTRVEPFNQRDRPEENPGQARPRAHSKLIQVKQE